LKGDDAVGIQLIKVPVAQCDFRLQPRSDRDPAYCLSLGESMSEIGQQVPIIGYFLGKAFLVVEGACRCEGARLVGITELLALDLGKEPTRDELLMAQATIDIYKKHFLPMDRARLWHAIKQERGCTNRELAKALGVSDSIVGDAFYLLTLPQDVQEQVNTGALDASKASLIAQVENDPHRQRELAALGAGMSRTNLIARLKKNRRDTQQTALIRVNSVRCALPSSIAVTVKGKELGLDEVIDALGEAQKEARKARDQNLDVKTWSAVMRDRARAKGEQTQQCADG
jgi:ParB family chromosome partitioning protein